MSRRATTRPDAPFIVTLLCHAPDTADVGPVPITVETRRTERGYICASLTWGGRGPIGEGATIAAAEQEFKYRLHRDGLSPEEIEIITRLAGQRLLAELHPSMGGAERRGYVLGGEALEHIADLIAAFAVHHEPPARPEPDPPMLTRDVLMLAVVRLDDLGRGDDADHLRGVIDSLDNGKGTA